MVTIRCLLVVLILLIPCLLRAESRPNIILILADDLGYGDLGVYGHPQIKTPVLDRMAKEGIKLTDFYAGASVCTPSRMALLSGCYPGRVGWKQGVIGHKMAPAEGLDPRVVTIAEVFKSAGYATGMFGKWHVGSEGPCLPHRQGFDSAFYIDKSNNLSKEFMQEDQKAEEPFENRRLTEKFTKEALRFITEHRDRPFFLYLPYSAPHFPVEAHPEWQGRSTFGAYGDVVEELDHRIGDIMKTLEEHNLSGKTMIVFLSDNGPQGGEMSRASPYRGMKWSALEGGHRVPCIAYWPGKIPAGLTSNALISAIDLLPTLAAAAGIDWRKQMVGAQVVDGVDVWNTLCGIAGEHPRNDLLYWSGMGELQAIRVGTWKLFLHGSGVKSGMGLAKRNSAEVEAALKKLGDEDRPLLFDLASENDELTDHSLEQPQLVQRMQALAEQRMTGIQAQTIPLYR